MKRMHYGHGLLILAAVLTIAVWPVTAQAQLGRPVQLWDGTLQAVDCEDAVFMFTGQEGTVQFTATDLTAFFAGADRLMQLCALSPFVGTRARVWWVTVDGERVAGRVQILVFPGQSVIVSEPSGDHDQASPPGGGGNGGGNGGGDTGGGSGGDNGGGSGGDNGGGSGGDNGGGSGGDNGGGSGGDNGGGGNGGGSGGWPGHGHGDSNHDHAGPPGHTDDKPGNGNGGSGAPGQQGK